MYRLDLVQNQAEFVGGFGQRIVALRSQAMSVSPEFFKATFPATDQTNNAEFKVTIQRDDLSYRLEGAKLAAMLGDSDTCSPRRSLFDFGWSRVFDRRARGRPATSNAKKP